MKKNNKPKQVSSKLYDARYYKQDNRGFSEFQNNKGLPDSITKKIKGTRFKNKVVLDLGCGRGEFIREASLRGSTVYGIDYSKESVKISLATIKDLNEEIKKRVHIIQMDIKKLDFDDDMFDLVTGFDIIEHLHDWELRIAIKEIKRVLKPSGKLILHTSPNRLMMGTVRAIVGLFGIKLRSDAFHVNEMSFFSVRNYFKDFSPKISLEKDKNYFSNQMDFRGITLKIVAKILDSILDFVPIHKLLSTFPFSIFWCTDIWIFGAKK